MLAVLIIAYLVEYLRAKWIWRSFFIILYSERKNFISIKYQVSWHQIINYFRTIHIITYIKNIKCLRLWLLTLILLKDKLLISAYSCHDSDRLSSIIIILIPNIICNANVLKGFLVAYRTCVLDLELVKTFENKLTITFKWRIKWSQEAIRVIWITLPFEQVC